MLKMKDRVYRFKFEVSAELPHMILHIFEVSATKPDEGFAKNRVRFKCVNDSTATYKDGLFVSAYDLNIGKVKSSGNAIYVTLLENNEKEAKTLIQKYLEDRVSQCEAKLNQANDAYNAFLNSFN